MKKLPRLTIVSSPTMLLLADNSHYWQIVTPRIYSLVCFRLLPPNGDEACASKLNHALLDAVNSTGKIFISHTVSSLSSTSRHIDNVFLGTVFNGSYDMTVEILLYRCYRARTYYDLQ